MEWSTKMPKTKAIKVKNGYAVKRKARVEHDCHDCLAIIEEGEDYYQVTLRSYHTLSGWYTKSICEQCWLGMELEA